MSMFCEQFLSLLNSDAAFHCEVIRDCYEAFALYCFERYLIACLGMSSGVNLVIISFCGTAFFFFFSSFKYILNLL